MAPKVLVADKLSRLALDIFARRGIDAHVKTDLTRDELIEIIPGYDGIAVRSATKVTEKVVAAADQLKVIGRAGIGVDNVDLKAATSRGIIVMNTPFGNSITTAEHAIALMLALARQVPLADLTTRAGKWAKSELIGVEITGKCLGIIGCGNIGAIVADRARGLKMKVVAFDPYLSPERATDLGVEKVELDALFRRADFITLHTPLTDKTRKIINGEAIRTMRDGVRIINCARGGLIDEQALFEALQTGKVAGAAIDVYEVEPATDNILFTSGNVICTPHLGASTREAQENVAIQIAEQISDFLLDGAITNALNFPAISAEERPKLTPFPEACRAAWLLRRPDRRDRAQVRAHRICRRGGEPEHKSAHRRGAIGSAHPVPRASEHDLRPYTRQGARHHGGGGYARPVWGLRDLYKASRWNRA